MHVSIVATAVHFMRDLTRMTIQAFGVPLAAISCAALPVDTTPEMLGTVFRRTRPNSGHILSERTLGGPLVIAHTRALLSPLPSRGRLHMRATDTKAWAPVFRIRIRSRTSPDSLHRGRWQKVVKDDPSCLMQNNRPK